MEKTEESEKVKVRHFFDLKINFQATRLKFGTYVGTVEKRCGTKFGGVFGVREENGTALRDLMVVFGFAHF